MNRFGPAILVLLCLAPMFVRAGGDKQLQNVKGSVSYEHGGRSGHPIARSATVVLGDSDFAVTGNASIGAVVLPESSRVTIGSDTRVQLAFFNQVATTSAKFIIYRGTTRFRIEHPNGRPSNYTFQTPTAQIAVRGTEGDIGVDGRDLTVNVYGLSDPNLPVVVTTEDGKKYVVRAGQQLLANWVNGQMQTSVGALTGEALARFQELGSPISDWQNAAQNLAQDVTGGLISNVSPFGIPSLGGHRSNQTAQDSAAPSASPSPCATPQQNKMAGFLKKLVNASSDSTACASPSPVPSATPK